MSTKFDRDLMAKILVGPDMAFASTWFTNDMHTGGVTVDAIIESALTMKHALATPTEVPDAILMTDETFESLKAQCVRPYDVFEVQRIAGIDIEHYRTLPEVVARSFELSNRGVRVAVVTSKNPNEVKHVD